MGLLKKLQGENGATDDHSEPDGLDHLPPEDDAAATAHVGQAPAKGATPIRLVKSAGEAQAEKSLPPELAELQGLLQAHDWEHSNADDAARRAAGRVEWTIIEAHILRAVQAGHAKEVESMWGQFAPAGKSLAEAMGRYGEEFKALAVQGQAASGQHRGYAQSHGASASSAPEQERTHQFSAGPATAGAASAGAGVAPFLNTLDPNTIDVDAREIPREPFSDGFRKPEWAKRAEPTPQAPESTPQQAEQQPAAAGTAVAGGSDLLSKMLSAPFAAGSLVLNSLRSAGQQAKSFYVKSKINGHAILGQQLDAKTTEIGALTASLKKAGMGALIDEMRLTGRPAKEIFSNMINGEHSGILERFEKLMAKPGFAADFTKLQAALSDFTEKATRYAKSGVDLDVDFSDLLDRNLQKVSEFTEGFFSKKEDGVIENLQEIAQQVADRVAEIANNIMRRFAPQ